MHNDYVNEMSNFYHAGPKGLTEILPLRDLIEGGVYSVDEAVEAWAKKWGDFIEEDVLLTHPTMDEISLTTDLEEARDMAEKIGGCVYLVDAEIHRTNEEGYPTCLGPVACEVVE